MANRRTTFLFALAISIIMAGCKGSPASDMTPANSTAVGEEKPTKSVVDPVAKELMDLIKEQRSPDIGSYVTFGIYEQDNLTGNGAEEIEWLVLDKEEDKILLLSRYALDSQPYHSEGGNITWENCSLRHWLNHVFYETAFISEERDMILVSEIKADANPKYNTPAGKDTSDRIFLLSVDEVNRYFKKNGNGVCQITPYCQKQGVSHDRGVCNWWLRTPGGSSDTASIANSQGWGNAGGAYVESKNFAVRPAIWVCINP